MMENIAAPTCILYETEDLTICQHINYVLIEQQLRTLTLINFNIKLNYRGLICNKYELIPNFANLQSQKSTKVSLRC